MPRRSRGAQAQELLKEQFYTSILKSPRRLLSIIFIIGSLVVWYSILTVFLRTLTNAHFGTDSASVVEKITATPTEAILIGIPFYILVRVQDKTLWLITTIFGFLNALMYIAKPQQLFKWVGYNQTES